MTDERIERAGGAWPPLRVLDWTPTRETLHMWLQVVGKVRLAKEPMLNHWWQVPLYVSPRGLTTSAITDPAVCFEVEFDFLDHVLHVRCDHGGERRIALEAKPVAVFYEETMRALRELGVEVEINPRPVEVEEAIPFPEDRVHASYVPEHAEAVWRQLVQADRLLRIFRGRFLGKVSPVHFFWGAMDLAVTRFSGRPAPPHPGGAPNVGDWVMVEAYSHEVSSAGFWPGGGEEGAFYAYAYPEPEGFRDWPVRPEAARYDADLGEFVLPYEAVRTAPDPDAAVLDFLQTTYEAAAELGDWDRAALEDSPEREARLRRLRYTP